LSAFDFIGAGSFIVGIVGLFAGMASSDIWPHRSL
jgi:hypothetical protein